MLQPGTPAPDFSAQDQNGKIVSLHSLKGKKVALFFYPKDNTPTCTEQACSLRDRISVLRKKKIAVIGVSMDSVRRHKSFEQKFSLPFPLLADIDRRIIDAFGVWGEKTLFGRTYMGIRRTTFLIDESGLIAHVIEKVDAKDHAAQILKTWGL